MHSDLQAISQRVSAELDDAIHCRWHDSAPTTGTLPDSAPSDQAPLQPSAGVRKPPPQSEQARLSFTASSQLTELARRSRLSHRCFYPSI